MNLKRRTIVAIAALLLSALGLYAQKIQVKGVVLDDEGMPFPGASVVEVGTRNGVSTDLDGHFTLSVRPEAVLEISFIGFETQQVKTGTKNMANLNITLHVQPGIARFHKDTAAITHGFIAADYTAEHIEGTGIQRNTAAGRRCGTVVHYGTAAHGKYRGRRIDADTAAGRTRGIVFNFGTGSHRKQTKCCYTAAVFSGFIAGDTAAAHFK